MKLTAEQAYQALAKHGSYLTNACDKCGKLLAEVGFTVKGEPGEWCSRECRGGEAAHAPGTCRSCGATLKGKRKRALYCDDTCRKRFRVNNDGQDRQTIPETPIQNKALTEAKSGSLAYPLTPTILVG